MRIADAATGGHDGRVGRRWDATHEVWRDVRELAREAFTRPERVHYPYIRCDRCGRVGPHMSIARSGSFHVTERGIAGVTTPPETVCPLCRHAQPRTVGDELPGTVEVACAFRWGLRLGWRRCATVHAVPAEATLIACPVCGTLRHRPGR